MTDLLAPVLVLVGGFVGGCLRHLVTEAMARLWDARFPLGTLAVNVTGCFAIGMVAALIPAEPATALLRDFAVFGLLGGYTTVSSFALQSVSLWRDGAPLPAALYVVGSMGLCLAAVAAGYWAGASLVAAS